MTPNVVLGIDPGPRDWSWALYQEIATDNAHEQRFTMGAVDMVSWDMLPPWWEPPGALKPDLVAIEDFTHYGKRVGKDGLDTAKTIGFLQAYFEHKGLPVILISRQKISSVICGVSSQGNARVNARMKELVPALKGRKAGLTGHMRAAAAVAYVAPGVYEELRLRKGITNAD